MQTDFSIQIDPRPEGVIARLQGHATNTHAAELRQALIQLIGNHGKVVIDLKELAYIASMAIAELINFRVQFKDQADRLRIAGANHNVADVFVQTHLDTLFPMFDDSEQALEED